MNIIYEVEQSILKDIEIKCGLKLRQDIEIMSQIKKRLAMFVAICSKKDAWLKQMVKSLSSKTVDIDKFIERIRKYIPIGEVEKKSFGEIFTPFSLINEMLDTLPVEVWSNPNLKWGDFCNGVGNFMVIIIKRLMEGLKTWETDENKRYKHIIENMIYVAELQIKNMFIWMVSVDSKNEYKLNLYRGNSLEKEFDQHMREVWKVEKMDIMVGNPPYNEEFKENNNRPKTLYHSFVEKSIKFCDQILMVTPSRWLTGGFGLDNFRKMMFNRNDIKLIKHFDDATTIFGKGVEIKGGISYFLIDKNYNGLCEFNGKKSKFDQFDIFVDIKYHEILNKINSNKNLSNICKSQSYFGFPGNESLFTKTPLQNSLKVYVSKNKGLEMWVDKNIIDLKKASGFKVFTPGAAGSTNDLGKFGNKIIGYPNEVCSKSYITFLVDSEKEAKSLISYLNTKFCNFFLSLRKKTQNLKPDTLKWIPMVPFDRDWTDEQLYKHFNLSEEEINLIK